MEYIIINKVSELPAFDKDLPIMADIETDGLYGPLRMIQLYQPQTSELVYIVDIAPIGYDKDNYHYELQAIKDFINSHYTVYYNASYDLGTLNISPDKVDDLFYIVKTAYAEFQDFGLKKIVQKLRYTKDLYDGIETKEAVKGFISGAYISQQAYKYAALDVYSMSLIWNDPKIQYVKDNNMAYKVDMISQHYALQYQQNGLVLHRKLWEEELIKASKAVVEYTALLPQGFNPNSYKQVRAYLDTTESDAEALVAYALSDKPLAKHADYIIKLKKAKKQKSYLQSIEFDKMYTKFNVAGAITGRFTSSGGSLVNAFNAQQIPREFQYLFHQPTDDTIVVHADYSTLELRLACTIYGSEHMYKQLKDGRDLHAEMACATSGKAMSPDGILGWDDTSDKYITALDRQRAKGVNFGFVFGMSAKTYVPFAFTNYSIKTTLDEATAIRNNYFKLYPEFSNYHNNVWNNYKKPGFFVYTALGRKIKPKLGTDGINAPVQGSGVETTKLAVHYLIKANPDKPILSWIYNVVHDSIFLRIPKHEEEFAVKALDDAMVKAWVEISKTKLFIYKDIPMPVDVEIEK